MQSSLHLWPKSSAFSLNNKTEFSWKNCAPYNRETTVPIIGNSPYIIQNPVSCRKRQRLTLKIHTVSTVIINKNIITSKNAVWIALYFFSFSAASFSLTLPLSSFCVSTMVENESSKRHAKSDKFDRQTAIMCSNKISIPKLWLSLLLNWP